MAGACTPAIFRITATFGTQIVTLRGMGWYLMPGPFGRLVGGGIVSAAGNCKSP